MANEKILDMAKSAAANETAVNNKFAELSQQGGGSSGDSHAEEKPAGYYGLDYGMGYKKEGNVISEMRTLFNSVRFNEELAANRVWTQTDRFAHGGSIAAGDGVVYCTHTINTTSNHDSPYDPVLGIDLKVMLYVHDMGNNLAQLASTVVAEHGDAVSINGTTHYIVSGAGGQQPFPITGGVRIIFIAGVHQDKDYSQTSERVWYTFYRDFLFDKSNNTLTAGTIGVCTIGGELMNNANIEAALDISPFNDQNRTIAMINQYAERTENNVTYYYIGAAYNTELRSGVILRTMDFKEFSVWWKLPDLPEGQTLKYEFSLCDYLYYSNYHYLAMAFRTIGDKHLIWIVDWAETNGTHSTKAVLLVPTCANGYGGRSCWLPQPPGTSGTLQLIYDTPDYGRRSVNVLRFDSPNGIDSNTSVVAQTYYMSYPSVIYYDGCYYVSYTDLLNGRKTVCVSKFSPFKYDGRNVIPILSKILDTFEPSED